MLVMTHEWVPAAATAGPVAATRRVSAETPGGYVPGAAAAAAGAARSISAVTTPPIRTRGTRSSAHRPTQPGNYAEYWGLSPFRHAAGQRARPARPSRLGRSGQRARPAAGTPASPARSAGATGGGYLGRHVVRGDRVRGADRGEADVVAGAQPGDQRRPGTEGRRQGH